MSGEPPPLYKPELIEPKKSSPCCNAVTRSHGCQLAVAPRVLSIGRAFVSGNRVWLDMMRARVVVTTIAAMVIRGWICDAEQSANDLHVISCLRVILRFTFQPESVSISSGKPEEGFVSNTHFQ